MKKFGRSNGRNSSVLGANDTTYNTRAEDSRFTTRTGLRVARVVDNADPAYDGNIWVEIVGENNTSPKDSQEQRHSLYTKIRTVQSQGGTITGENYTTQYGSSFSPPSIETEVLVAFAEGIQEGFLVGSLAPTGRNASIPGLSASPLEEDETIVAPTLDQSAFSTQEGNKRIRHPIAERIAEQGTALDPIRGIGSEGARRESPSRVSGFSSPSGHSFVMDDGTEEYQEGANQVPDQSRKSGTNRLIRLRSAGGAQLLLNDEAGIVYITSGTGNSWIQMDSDGNVDVYAAKSISYHSEDSINFYAADAFNIEADTVNIKANSNNLNLEAASADINLYATKNANITSDLNINLKGGGDIRETSVKGNIHLNGPVAETAEKPVAEPLPSNRGVKESINGRVPEHEPYGGHTKNSLYVASQARSSSQTTSKDLSTEA